MAQRSSRSRVAVAPATDHLDRIGALAERRELPSADDEIATSWQRCVTSYGVDPESNESPRVLTQGELKRLQEPLAKLIFDARDELDRLHSVVRQARYVVLLCDDQGVAVDHRGNPAEADEFKYWGTWLGGVWTEDVEGTNGIGTCIIDERPVTVHRSQHFRERHASLSCSGAPIFDVEGKLAAVLDVSSIDPNLSEQSHALTGALTQASARAIQERSFREGFRQAWIVAIAPPDGGAMLIAVDRDQRLIGADRNARALLARGQHSLETGVGLWALFERQVTLFRRKDDCDVTATLTPVGTAELWPALITPPAASASKTWCNPETAGLYTRPRLDAIGRAPQLALPDRARGGLPPGVLRRVRDYIETHLAENIGLETLAATADLSMFHFARAFKQSQGMTPHAYLLQRRIERAQELLTGTELPLSVIALATGFSDQSHLARQFRERVGMAPSAFRWSKR
jgi:AraC-like DNA-binding protein